MKDERFNFRFSTKDCFSGLDDYLNSPDIEVRRKKLKYDISNMIQTYMFKESNYGIRVRSGRYFEILDNGIFGGSLGEIHKFNEDTGNGLTSEPDITHLNTNRLRETKSVVVGECLRLTDEQIGKYSALQLGEGNYFPAFPEIVYDIFRHGVRKMTSRFGKENLKDLIENQSKNTRFMISLPFGVIHHIADPYNEYRSFTSRYWGLDDLEGQVDEGKKADFGPTTKLLSPGLNNLLAYPEETFHTQGLNPDNYEFYKRKLPKGMRMNNFRIKPFPILIVKEKDPRKSLEDLKIAIKERRENIAKELYDKYGYVEDPDEIDFGHSWRDEGYSGEDDAPSPEELEGDDGDVPF